MFTDSPFAQPETEAQKTEYEIRHRKSLAIRRAAQMVLTDGEANFSQAISILRNEGLTEAAVHLKVSADHFWEARRLAMEAAQKLDQEERECSAVVPFVSGFDYKISQ